MAAYDTKNLSSSALSPFDVCISVSTIKLLLLALPQITEGPNAGKLALIDFGLVAEIPRADREAMVSATIHLANRDWDALVDDFIALGFLPQSSDRCVCVCVCVCVRVCVCEGIGGG